MADPGPSDGSAHRVDGPAFYALPGGGWRDYWTLLHPPYTVWHLSYVVLGACVAPQLRVQWLVETAAAFFLAMGVAAHALDELHGRPLGTGIPDAVLVSLAVVGIAAAIALGLHGAAEVSPWIWAFIVTGAFLVPAYNLEWFGGALHSDLWFALAWGAFPALTAGFAQGGRLDPGDRGCGCRVHGPVGRPAGSVDARSAAPPAHRHRRGCDRHGRRHVRAAGRRHVAGRARGRPAPPVPGRAAACRGAPDRSPQLRSGYGAAGRSAR